MYKRTPTAVQMTFAELKMFVERTHHVANRIVSINQPYIRPIVRSKAKSPVEFGIKYDMSIDSNGHARLETYSFDSYNESQFLIDTLENYKSRMRDTDSHCFGIEMQEYNDLDGKIQIISIRTRKRQILAQVLKIIVIEQTA